MTRGCTTRVNGQQPRTTAIVRGDALKGYTEKEQDKRALLHRRLLDQRLSFCKGRACLAMGVQYMPGRGSRMVYSNVYNMYDDVLQSESRCSRLTTKERNREAHDLII
jgi:hypothetical protein